MTKGEKERVVILEHIHKTFHWPQDLSQKEKQELIDTGFCFVENSDVILTSLGELEIGFEEL